MRSLLQQLENNESVLLLYLADELQPEDRAEVEQMLVTDSALRAELQGLVSLQEMFVGSMGALDASMPLPTGEASARKMAQLMARQAILQATMPTRELSMPPAPRLRIGGWMYPVAIAAMALVAVGWWGRLPWNDHNPRITHHGNDRYTLNDGRESAGQDLPMIPVTTDTDHSPLADATSTAELFDLTSDGDGDRSMLAVAAASVDVSSLFDWDANDLRDTGPQ